MNFSYAVIAIVGVLVAITLGFIAVSPDDIPEPRIVEMSASKVVDIDAGSSDSMEQIACTLQYDPQCGVDGETYGNSCMLDAADVKLDYSGECVVESIPEPVKQISINSHIMPNTAIVGDTLLVEVEFRDDDDIIIDHVNYDITAIQDNQTILSDLGSHRHPGKHPIHETTTLGESPVEIKVIIQGLGHGDDITEPKGIESSIILMPDVIPEVVEVIEPEAAMNAIVVIPPGAAVPGCDETDECFLPFDVSVAVGATVLWSNDDSAAHTVSSGTIDAGLTGVFDSGLFMAGDSFEFTFDTAGTYDYFCMVHPWMTGTVNVN